MNKFSFRGMAVLGMFSLTGCGNSSSLPSLSAQSLVSLGDSISVGLSACNLFEPCPSAVWSSGSEPYALASRLELQAYSQAVSGARITDLPAQVENRTLPENSLFTVLIGGNDVCAAAPTSPQNFQSSIARTLDTIGGTSNAQVLVLSVPDATQLPALAASNPLASAAYASGQVCPGASSSSSAALVESYNDILEEECGRREYCIFDEDRLLSNYVYSESDISPDYFHPSVQGQEAIANIAHRVLEERFAL